MKICKLCKKEYKPSGNRQFFCQNCRIIKRKEWNKKYDNSERARKKQSKRDREPLALARYKRYRNTEKYKEKARLRYKNMPNNKKKARYYLRNAIRDKRIKKLDYCEQCNIKDWGVKRSMIEAHHYLGYEKNNRLKVRWLCTNCHKLAEKVR